MKLLSPTPNLISPIKFTRAAEPTALPLVSNAAIQSPADAGLPFNLAVPWITPPILVLVGLKLSGTIGLTVTIKLVETVSTPPLLLPPLSFTVIVNLAVPITSGAGLNVIVPLVSGDVYVTVGFGIKLVLSLVAVIVKT